MTIARRILLNFRVRSSPSVGGGGGGSVCVSEGGVRLKRVKRPTTTRHLSALTLKAVTVIFILLADTDDRQVAGKEKNV